MSRKKPPKILIVEDDPNVHPLYREAFTEGGFDVTILPNADGFFAEEVDRVQPDVISMDIMIGKEGRPTERDGFEAIELLRSDLRTNEIPIIVLSNFSEETRIERAKKLGAVDYIVAIGYSPKEVARIFMKYVDDPKHYVPLHPAFRKTD